MRFLWLLPFLAAVVVSRAAAEDEYYPLAEGMEWTMDVKITLPNGQQLQSIARRKVETTEERDGKTYYRAHEWIVQGPGPKEHSVLMRKDAAGAYSLDLGEANSKEQTECLFPLEVGKSWPKTDTSPGKYEVLAIESVSIDGKTYEKCAHIRLTLTNGTVAEDVWEAPGIGSVKSALTLSDGVKVQLTLREFKPGKK